MSKKQKRAREPTQKRSVAFVTNSGWETLECAGYTSLAHNPEITTAVDTIARLIGSMTIHLMENTEHGDIRVRNELSRKVDIDPNQYMTRSAFVQWIVKTMMLDGNRERGGVPGNTPGDPAGFAARPGGVCQLCPRWLGIQSHHRRQAVRPGRCAPLCAEPRQLLPLAGGGLPVALSDVANNLKQAAATEKGFMSSKWKPSIIVKVDSLTDEFSSPEGRRKLLEDYVETTEAGEPWMIPADQFSVEQVRPLTLSDLALADFVQLDKRTVAAILGVPPFVLGVGDFHREAWNNFISSTIMPIARMIEQELTRKLLVSPNWFFRFNVRSLYNYELRDMAQVADDQFVRGIMTGNEVRDWIGMPPLDGLNELVILENYIPRGMIGDQNKLNGGDSA